MESRGFTIFNMVGIETLMMSVITPTSNKRCELVVGRYVVADSLYLLNNITQPISYPTTYSRINTLDCEIPMFHTEFEMRAAEHNLSAELTSVEVLQII